MIYIMDVTRKRTYLLMSITLFVGITWVHIDYLVIMVVFSLIFLIPLLGFLLVLLIIMTVKGFIVNKNQLKKKGIIGLATFIIFVLSSFLSVLVVDKFNRYQGEELIARIDQHRKYYGRYPDNLRAVNKEYNLLQFSYFHNGETDSYSISFKSGGLTTTKFDSRTREWTNYGWND